jgi:hypothetical protein
MTTASSVGGLGKLVLAGGRRVDLWRRPPTRTRAGCEDDTERVVAGPPDLDQALQVRNTIIRAEMKAADSPSEAAYDKLKSAVRARTGLRAPNPSSEDLDDMSSFRHDLSAQLQ